MKSQPIVIIDYGIGNVRSVANAVARLGYDFVISKSKRDIEHGTKFIMAGVGAFAEGMKNLKDFDLIDVLKEQVIKKRKPILGICLGMQLLADSSEEGGWRKGLGWIPGRVVKFSVNKTPRVPHVGWNSLRIVKKQPLFVRPSAEANYYFDHSYYFKGDKKNILATCRYGIEFAAAIRKNNIYGVQFHPEKSQANGLKLLRSFLC